MSIKSCPKCKEHHNKSGFFCSRTCANSRGPRTDDFKTKVSAKLKGIPSGQKGKPRVPRTEGTCFICGALIVILETAKELNVTCKSKKCLRESSSIAGKKSAAIRNVRSKDEIALYQLCDEYFGDVLANHVITDGWDADIAIPSKKIAILWNGPWHYRDMNMKNHSLKQVQTRDAIKLRKFHELDWKVFVFEDRYYTPVTAFEELVREEGFEPPTDRFRFV